MRILFLSPWFPFPPVNGSELRINTLIRGLAARHEVTLVSFQRRPVDETQMRAAREYVAAVHLISWREFQPGGRRARLGFLSARPRSVVDTHSPEMADCIRRALDESAYDAVIASQTIMAAYWPAFQGIPALLEEAELGVYRQQVDGPGAAPVRLRRRLMWAKQCTYMRSLLPRFAACTVVSERERSLLRGAVPNYDPVEIIPNCIDLPVYTEVRADPEPDTLVFTGSFAYGVNHDAMDWFVRDIYPLVRDAVPEARLVITGDPAGRALPPAANVTQTGYLDDIKPLVAAAAVSLAPIRYGGGTRLKILEAMALGTPVVATSKGAEGLDVTDGEHLLIADTPEEFARAVVAVLRDDGLRRRMAAAGQELVRVSYTWEGVMPRFLALVDRVIEQSGGAT